MALHMAVDIACRAGSRFDTGLTLWLFPFHNETRELE
jgi:hypothetical protein